MSEVSSAAMNNTSSTSNSNSAGASASVSASASGLASAGTTVKRKRTPSAAPSPSAPPAKASKTTTSTGSQLQINYLARQCTDDLPLISKDDTLPNLLDVLTSYSQVLDRQESLASNLGARPLGPILIKRFERCFDAPPKIIASHSHAKGPPSSDDEASPTVTWLDVVHFAQAHPAQFTLATFSEGRRVCQFYYPQKQVRVQVSEEDFLFISSGRSADLIPPLPIWEDEEKEVGTCEILEKALRELTNAADLVAARTRQLGHRLRGRRMAIQERRTEQGHTDAEPESQSHTPPTSGLPRPSFAASNPHPTHSPHPAGPSTGRAISTADKSDSGAAVRTDLLKHFQSLPHNHSLARPDSRRASLIQPLSPAQTTLHNPALQSGNAGVAAAAVATAAAAAAAAAADGGQASSSSVSPIPTTVNAPSGHALDPLSYYIDNTPTSFRASFTPSNPANPDAPKHNFSRPLPPSQESSQPYRALCQSHMESLPRGSRVLPPCDRCRRLRMDCLKNLSSCAGCTKKHARCHWKDVRREEVQALDGFEEADMADRHAESHDAANNSVDSLPSRHSSHERDENIRRLSEENIPLNHDPASAILPPIRHGDPEQTIPSVNHSHAGATYPTQPQQSMTHQHQQQQTSHHEPDTNSGGPNMLPNPFSRRTDGEDNNHAFDLLRLLGRDTAHAGSPGAGSGSGPRNNGAFRSVYSSHGSESRPNETSPSNTGTGLVGLAGGDRP